MLIDDIILRRQQLRRSLHALIDFGKDLRNQARTRQRDELQVDAYALVCEVAREVLKERPDVRRTQIQAALELAKGKIVEMQNGEGKTLVATMPAYLNSLKEGRHVHIATYNDYLAHRDALWMGPIYDTLGLKVGVIESEASYELQLIPSVSLVPTPSSAGAMRQESARQYRLTPCTRARAYNCNITYGSHLEFALDYLRDNTVMREEDMVQNSRLDYIILDEADSVLIDNAHTPVQVVEKRTVNAQKYLSLCRVAYELQPTEHYSIVLAQSNIELTMGGVAFAEQLLRQEGLLNRDHRLYSVDAPAIASQLIQALRVKHFYHRDEHYIVEDACVKPLNIATGRRLKRGTFPGGIQQAIEAQEGVPITELNITKASISYQHFFKHYEIVAGMTATAKEHRQELRVVYNKQIVEIKPFKVSQRQDLNDFIYKTSEGRLQGVIDEIAWRHAQGRPQLINVRSIEQADELGNRLIARGIDCKILYAKNEEAEVPIVECAGQRGAVTVSAEMAGRGTDIQIDDDVKLLGGLHVIGVGRHESRYMDRQLIGRAGRQGKPGSSQFFLSTEDPLIIYSSLFNMPTMLQRVGVEDDAPTDTPYLKQLVENTQKRNERYYFERRRLFYERDRLLDKQRDSIYRVRRKIVRQVEDLSEELATIRKNVVARATQRYLPGTGRKQWQIEELAAYFVKSFGSTRFHLSDFDLLEDTKLHKKQIPAMLLGLLDSAYKEEVTSYYNGDQWVQKERSRLLFHLDNEWAAFLWQLDELQEENMLRSDIEEQSFEWYAVESFRRFQKMMEGIEEGFLKDMFDS